MEKPLMVEIFAADPAIFTECMDCETVWRDIETTLPTHRQRVMAHLPGASARDYFDTALWAVHLSQEYGDLINTRIIDALSLEGVVKSAQYGVHTYPAVVINHGNIYDRHSLEQASQEIEHILRAKMMNKD